MITRGHNYSFAVAVTDSTVQHGPWSDQLTVTYDGIYMLRPDSQPLTRFEAGRPVSKPVS